MPIFISELHVGLTVLLNKVGVHRYLLIKKIKAQRWFNVMISSSIFDISEIKQNKMKEPMGYENMVLLSYNF